MPTNNEQRLAREVAELKRDVEFLARRGSNFEQYTNEQAAPRERRSTVQYMVESLGNPSIERSTLPTF
jgi:hypothetical protein